MSWLSLNIFLSDVRSEIQLVRRNFVSTGQSVRAYKNTWIYNLKSCPHITRVPVVFAKKRKISSKSLF